MDHAGGTKELAEMHEGKLKIYGGDNRIAALTDKLGKLNIECLHTPCHTSGHICYYVTRENQKVVFTGDTLFIAGCGRFFEGTAEQMDTALNGELAKLPSDTKVFCGHEYTVDDLKFAKAVEPSNVKVTEKLEWAMKQRSKNLPTIPSTIQEELQTNPFMRVRCSKELQEASGSSNPTEVMAALRERKNASRY
uniref:hydroxyacylglutathione hydrolase n=1 Tax=Syphacia muris TaxID=451379 RepID=A0A0N5AIF1_9BILA